MQACAATWVTGVKKSPWLRPLGCSLHRPAGALARTADSHADAVLAVRVTPDRRRAVTASADWTCMVWDLESGADAENLHRWHRCFCNHTLCKNCRFPAAG